MVNESLAKLLKDEPDPMELLAADQSLAKMVWITGTSKQLTSRGRLVQLECGHFVVTRALHKAACPRCGEMIRSGWDHDGFRRLKGDDTFSWPDDPLRILHEKEQGAEARLDPTGACERAEQKLG